MKLTLSTPSRILFDSKKANPNFAVQYEQEHEKTKGSIPPFVYTPLELTARKCGDPDSSTNLIEFLNHAVMVYLDTALATWQVSKGIYRFDPNVAEEVIKTGIDGELPSHLFERLPEYCIWVDPVCGLDGFFAHMEFNSEKNITTLRFVTHQVNANGEDTFSSMPIDLNKPSLYECLKSFKFDPENMAAIDTDELVSEFQPYVSLVLYLCSVGAEYKGGSGPTHPRDIPKPKRWTPVREKVWDLGERMGREIRRVKEEVRHYESSGQTRQGSTVRPHVRHAHWHLYYVGPRKNVPLEDRSQVVKWIQMTIVNKDLGEVSPTIQTVVPDT